MKTVDVRRDRLRVAENAIALLNGNRSQSMTYGNTATIATSIVPSTQRELKQNGPVKALMPERRVRLITDEDLDAIQPPPAVVEDIIHSGGMSAVFGQSGHYKSFWAVDMDLSIAAGLDYHGKRVSQGAVVYIAGEGIYGMQKRVRAWKQHAGLAGSLPILFLKHGIALQQGSADVKELIAEIEEKLEVPPIKITVDTLARNFVGNESASEDMNRFVAGCSELQDATGAHVMIVHHSGWSELERLRGSSVLHCALDTEILCTKDGSRLTVECKKQKDAVEFAPMAFQTLTMAGSLVLTPMALHAGKIDGNRALGLSALVEANGPISYATWMKLCGMEDKKSSFKSMRKWILEMAYGRQVSGSAYEATEAGRQAWHEQRPEGQREAIEGSSPTGISGPSTPGVRSTPVALAHDPDEESHES